MGRWCDHCPITYEQMEFLAHKFWYVAPLWLLFVLSVGGAINYYHGAYMRDLIKAIKQAKRKQ